MFTKTLTILTIDVTNTCYNSKSSMTSKVFVTVGTTTFDQLIATTTSPTFQEELISRGFTHITAQIGRYPDLITPVTGMTIRHFDYSLSIQAEIESADLVIAHAGAGTALEVLRKGKPLICVINDELMNNHQTELAEELSRGGHSLSATPSNLCKVFREAEFGQLKAFPPADPAVFRDFLASVACS